MRLEIGHPPGNPFWTLTHRVLTSFVAPRHAALVVNAASALFSALASLLLYLISFRAIRLLTSGAVLPVAAASVCGALMFAWCDSTLFSAVEAEVYSMSTFLTALMIWLMTVWYSKPDTPSSSRILLLIAYLAGLSIGVHQLNLLVLPALAAILVYKRYPGRVTWKLVLALAVSMGVIGFILKGIMPLSFHLAALCELVTVNHFGWPYFSGVIAFAIIAVALIVAMLWIVARRGRLRVYMAAWSFTLLIIGYTCYSLILIRGVANPPINEGVPATAFDLERYINREQYGSTPLLYGRTPFSKSVLLQTFDADSTPQYKRFALRKKSPRYTLYSPAAQLSYRSGFVTHADSAANNNVEARRHGYVLTEYNYEQITTPELNMWLPRITSSAPADLEEYEAWAGMDTASMAKMAVSDAMDSEGNFIRRTDEDGRPVAPIGHRPTYLQNLTFFGGYQLGYMYFRYLMWNFSGRQNDFPTTGEADHGNFITGIRPIDDAMLGPQSLLPAEAGRDNKGRNIYFMVPLLLGLVGLGWLICRGRKGRRMAMVSGLLFVLTGIAIVVYLNQSPGEPRERDYTFLVSYMVFAFWGGCGVYALASALRTPKSIAAATIASLVVPGWMLAQNYDDHCRRGRDTATAAASNILRSLAPNTILFVDGDNYTFPLWYAREALGIRPDVRIININYLAVPSYLRSLAIPTAGGDAVKMTAPTGIFDYGRFGRVKIPQSQGADTIDAIKALRSIYAPGEPSETPAAPSRYLRLGESAIVDLTEVGAFSGSGSRLPLRSLAMLDIAATAAADPQHRPVAWLVNLPQRSFNGLLPYTSDGYYVSYLHLPEWGDSIAGMPPRPILSGGADRHNVYLDPNAQKHVTYERVAAIRHAERMAGGGNPRGALTFIDSVMNLFPIEITPLRTGGEFGIAFHEAERLGSLLMRIGRETGDSSALEQGGKILAEHLALLKEWRRYRDALPPRLRRAVSFSTRRSISRIDTITHILDESGIKTPQH